VSKKQDRLDEAISLIRKALHCCGSDFATVNVRANLLAALREAGHVCDKRGRREKNNAMNEAAAKAMKLHTDWWSQIEENVRKKAQEDAEKVEQEKAPEEDT